LFIAYGLVVFTIILRKSPSKVPEDVPKREVGSGERRSPFAFAKLKVRAVFSGFVPRATVPD
jgi:hypothetical protein